MDYGHQLSFGSFITPTANPAQSAVALAQVSEQAGLDLVTFQDHPYQPAFLDTWTLLSYVAAQTDTIRLAGNVLNVPLRMPTLPRAAASLDLLSGGRFDLALGAGGFWDAIRAMGGPDRTPAESITALEEAIDIIRDTWDTAQRGGVFRDGSEYHVVGAKRGPRPAHDIPIWVGALKPRGLRLIGRKGDGWLPSEAYLKPGDLAAGMATIDAAATKAERDPREIRRLLNIGPEADVRAWAERLAVLSLDHGIGTFILATDDPAMLSTFGQRVAPRVRDLVDAGRASAGTSAAPVRSAAALAARAAGIDYDDIPPGVEAIEPGDFAFGAVRNTYMRGGNPGLVLLPRTTEQVADAVRFAARHRDLPLSIRSAGHGISGESTNDDGIVISLKHLHAIEVLDEATRRVRIEPGATWTQVAIALGQHGWALTSGDSGGVGVGGLATAGGIGYFSREFGLTIDHLVAADIVLADGSTRHVDADSDPKLFWAIRGAGANMGVVTSFEFIADEVGEVGFAQLVFDGSDLEELITVWGRAVEAAPRDTTGFLTIAPQAGGQIVAFASILVDQDDPDVVLSRLQPFAQVGPLLQQSASMSTYAQVIAESPQTEDHQGQGAPMSRSGLVRHLTPDFAARVATFVRSGATYFFQIRALGGAVADVSSDATAFAHRDANFSLAAFGSQRVLLDAQWMALARDMIGLYTSFEASDRPERITEAYPPATLARLRALKADVDPTALFRDNFAIGTELE